MSQSTLRSWLKAPSPPGDLRAREPVQEAAWPAAAENKSTGAEALDAPPAEALSDAKKLLPPQIAIAPLQAEGLASFRRLSTALLPLAYSDRYYASLLSSPLALSLVATWRDDGAASGKTVGVVTAMILEDAEDRNMPMMPLGLEPPTVYVSILGVAAPYRELGLGQELLNHILDDARKKFKVKSACVHVWERNEDGKHWYQRRGFLERDFRERYYSKLKPGGAWVMWKVWEDEI